MGTETIWLPTFFKISSFMFNRRNDSEAVNNDWIYILDGYIHI